MNTAPISALLAKVEASLDEIPDCGSEKYAAIRPLVNAVKAMHEVLAVLIQDAHDADTLRMEQNEQNNSCE